MSRTDAEVRIAAVVSTYYPDEAFPSRVTALAAQVAEVVVVDDGSRDDPADVLLEAARRGATVICLLRNSGIAAALNAGVDAAEATGHEFVLTLDQDSTVPAGFLSALASEHAAATRDGVRVGGVSPASIAGLSQASGAAVQGHVKAVRPIQSGTLYSLRVLRQAGPFDEGLFIDLVDAEYALRLERVGMESLIAPGLDLPHRLGDARQMRVLGRSVTVGLSSPFRYYYRARNRIIVGSRYFRAWPRAVLREALRDMFQLSWAVAFAKQPLRMSSVLLAGIVDGARKRDGQMPEPVAARARDIQWRGRDIAS